MTADAIAATATAVGGLAEGGLYRTLLNSANWHLLHSPEPLL